MRRAAAVDSNQALIVAALRKVGANVQTLNAVGCGVPDLLVGYRGVLYMLEIKDGAKVPSAQALTPQEISWHAEWSDHEVHVVNSIAKAYQVIGVKLAKP